MKEKYTITGMSCASCANHVYNAVSHLEGIHECNVNLLLNQMEIDKDETVSSENIINAVKESGYGASVYNGKNTDASIELKEKKKKLLISIILMVLLSYISMYSMFSLPIPDFLAKDKHPILYCFIQLILSMMVYGIYRQRIFKGISQLFKRKPTMDSLIGISCFASLCYGLYITFKIIVSIENASFYLNHLYYETGAMVLVFSAVGKYLEEKSKIVTTSAISSLIAMTPSFGYRIKEGKTQRIKAEEIRKGDILLVKPGGKVPTDGIVIEGHSYHDQSALSGESVPVEKRIGDTVLSGALNLNGTLTMEATCDYKDSSFSRIIELVGQAANSKAPVSRLADRISSIFVPAVIALSLITFLVWFFIGKDFHECFSYAMSVLVVSCPCALGLATPTAIMVASGKGAKMGILFKNAAVMEETSRIDTLVFDKTNTLTYGKMKVDNVEIFNAPSDFCSILYTMEKASEHPLSFAISEYAKANGGCDLGFESDYLIGKGICCTYNAHKYLLGSKTFIIENGTAAPDSLLEDIFTTLYFTQDNSLNAIIRIADPLKEGIAQCLNELKHYRTVLLSGDETRIAENVGHKVGIKEIVAQVMPDEKQKVIQDLQKEGCAVAMIGDGINDSIALTQANVGIAINNATDIAANASDVIIINEKFETIVNLFGLCKKTMLIIRENLFWALGYNIILIPLAAGVLSSFGIELNPMFCSAAMSLSSITVVSNALRINTYKPFKVASVSPKKRYSYTLDIDHMMCEHCQRSVENAMLNCDLVATTSLNPSVCTFECDEKPDFGRIKTEIEKAGYHITNISLTENQD